MTSVSKYYVIMAIVSSVGSLRNICPSIRIFLKATGFEVALHHHQASVKILIYKRLHTLNEKLGKRFFLLQFLNKSNDEAMQPRNQ